MKNLELKEGVKYIISSDAWFFAGDGHQYKAVWGEVTILSDEILGIKTNSRSTNWYVRVGTDENHVIIAGCQIHYAVRTDVRPVPIVKDYHIEKGEVIYYEHPTNIYIADKK